MDVETQKYICSKIDPIIMTEFRTLTENQLKIKLYRFQILKRLLKWILER
jgi:hypothetical protein